MPAIPKQASEDNEKPGTANKKESSDKADKKSVLYKREWSPQQSFNLMGMEYHPAQKMLYVHFRVTRSGYVQPWYWYKGVSDELAKALYNINMHPAHTMFNRMIRFNGSFIYGVAHGGPQDENTNK